jgi:hypothetical protein
VAVVSADPGTSMANQVWTGRATLVEIFEHDHVVDIIEMAARRDHVTVWKTPHPEHATGRKGDRTLAVMDRDAFRAWLLTGTGAFDIDDLVWTLDRQGLAMTVDGVTRYDVWEEMAIWLAAVM